MKKILLILILFTCSVLFGADNSDIIWTWGNGKFVASVVSFIYFLLNIDTLQVIIKFAGLIGVLIVFIREYSKGVGFQPSALALKLVFFFLLTQATVYWLLTVKQDAAHRVYILSANELAAPAWQKCRPVNGDDECYAPVGVKLLMSSLTNAERASIGMMESAMMDANALSYSFSRMGLGFGFTFYDHISKTKGDPLTYNTFMEFYENCIIYDLADGTKSVDTLYKSKDLASYIISPNSRLTNVYSSANPNGILKTCYEVSSASLWGSANCDKTAKELQAKASGSSASETTTGDICLAAENFGKLMFNTAKDAGQQIEQRTIMNLTNEAIVNSAIASGIDPSVLAYGTTMADREQTSKWMVLGVMAKEWIPAMRGIMQGIAIGIIWILAVLSIMTASPVQYLGTAVGFQVTLMVWSILLALINYATIDNMAGQLPNIFVTDLGVGDQMTLWSQPTFDEQNQKAMAFLGYMAIASYGIAAGLVKIGGNALSGSFSGIVGALSVGMGTSANAAKGHMDHGLSKVDSGGAQHVSRTGNVDVISASGYEQTQKSQSGYSGYKESVDSKYGGYNNLEKQSNADGSSSMTASTANNDQSLTVDNNGHVTNAKIAGISSKADSSVSHEIESMKGNSATLEKNASKSLSSSISNTNQTAQEFIHAATKEKGATAGQEIAKNYNEQVQQNIQKAYEDNKMSEDTYQKARSVDYSAGAEVAVSAKGGFELFGNGVSTSGTAKMSAATKASGQHNQSDRISLSEKDAETLSHAMSTGLASTAKTSQGLSDKLTEGVVQKSSDSTTATNQASQMFSESQKLAETASKMEKDKSSISASISRDVMLEVAQKVVDQSGLVRGSDDLFHNKGYVEKTANEIIQEKVSNFSKVDTGDTFSKANGSVGEVQKNIMSPYSTDARTANVNDIHKQYNDKVNTQGNIYMENMPSVSNHPTIPTNSNLESRVQSNQYDHSNGNIGVLANPTSSLVNAGAETVNDLVKDGNFKISADGTYTDRENEKHDWSKKGRTEH